MKNDLIALTGITGHLGYVLARQLVDRGCRVRAIVRNRNDALQQPWIAGLPVEFAQADIRDQPAMAKALTNVSGLFHVAAASDVTSKDAEARVIKHNLDGTKATLEAAIENKVERVIYTSSVAAVGTSANPRETRDESFWNTESPEPYARSKALSEQLAWNIAEKSGLELVTVLPGAILGPDSHRINPTLKLVESALRGKLPMAPPVDFNFVDVRDAAHAHIKLYEDATASGRYILAGVTMRVLELLELIKKLRPECKVASKEMPEWFARIFPCLDAMQSALTRSQRQMTSGFVQEYVSRTHVLNAGRARHKIGWNPRPFRDTLCDTLGWFEQSNSS